MTDNDKEKVPIPLHEWRGDRMTPHAARLFDQLIERLRLLELRVSHNDPHNHGLRGDIGRIQATVDVLRHDLGVGVSVDVMAHLEDCNGAGCDIEILPQLIDNWRTNND